MVDFYTLFLVLSKYESQIPLSSNNRDILRERLLAFGEEVTFCQKSIASEQKYEGKNQNVINYASGIRNSSDLGSRRIRDTALTAELADIFSPENWANTFSGHFIGNKLLREDVPCTSSPLLLYRPSNHIPHGIRRFPHHLRRGVGIGAQGKSRRVVAQGAGQGLYIHAVFQR